MHSNLKESTKIRKSLTGDWLKYHVKNLLKIWRPWIFEQMRWLKISCII